MITEAVFLLSAFSGIAQKVNWGALTSSLSLPLPSPSLSLLSPFPSFPFLINVKKRSRALRPIGRR